jgi:UbiD family decarboxylase
MPHQSLDEFITAADAVGEVRFVEGADWDLEVGCLAELSSEVEGPLLLFDAFEGFPRGYRVCTNSVRTPRRFALALGFPLDTHPVDLVRLWRERRQRFQPLAPLVVDDGPVLECQQDGSAVDVTRFPVPRWHEHDGGRYLGTGDLVVLRDPDGGWVNVGVYRACIQGPDRLSLWIIHTKHGRILAERHWRQGRPAPVALVLGCDPVTWSCGYLAPPFGVSEYDYAGALHGQPLAVIELPASGLPVPAQAEIVVEGEIPPPDQESVHEGPFGEWPGYYAHEGDECVVRVRRVYHRRSPILLGEPPQRPLGATATFGIPPITVQLWEHLERSGITDVAGVWSFGNTLMIVVALKTRYAGHAKQALLAAAGLRSSSSMYTYYVAVDDDVDPANLKEVLWAMQTRVDPATDVEIIHEAWTSDLDPRLSPAKRAAGELTVGRLLINACRPYAWKDQFPRTNASSPQLRHQVTEKYRDLLDSFSSPSARAQAMFDPRLR